MTHTLQTDMLCGHRLDQTKFCKQKDAHRATEADLRKYTLHHTINQGHTKRMWSVSTGWYDYYTHQL